MPSHPFENSPRTAGSPTRGGQDSVLLNSPSASGQAPYAPPSNSQVAYTSELHLLQPPPAPRLRNIPLPDPRVANLAHSPPATQNVFPIDLTRRIDFDLLAQTVQNSNIPAHTTIYILPTSREFTLLEINTGDTPATAVSIIRRLQTEMRASLSLQVYRVGLPPAAQRLVHDYFLLHSGPNGARLWQAFLHGARYPQGPRGAVLLRGYSCMWGFGQDYNGRWVLDVDVPLQL